MHPLTLVRFMSDLRRLSATKSLPSLQQHLKDFIQKINNTNLQELFCFIADDFLIKNKEWLEFLLEREFFKRSSGRQLFFKRLEDFLSQNNKDMVLFYTIAYRFRLKEENEKYLNLKNFLNLNNEKAILCSSYKPSIKNASNLLTTVLAPIISFVSINLIDIFILKYVLLY